MASNEFNGMSFIYRWAFAAALVFGTYNPTHISYVNWAFAEGVTFGPVIAFTGVALLIAWIIFLRATFNSMGWLGIVLGAALFGCLIWWLIDIDLLSLDAPSALTWVTLVLASLILATGMSWSHIRRRLTGQFDVDDMDD
jgi:hypothetical protein